ncbi:hypothetical protein BD408DRAFT_267481 [Parasitella parasitica]|nr:hypothetical protein BD408DRAFT_267481 [Parasitella parasitica]
MSNYNARYRKLHHVYNARCVSKVYLAGSLLTLFVHVYITKVIPSSPHRLIATNNSSI